MAREFIDWSNWILNKNQECKEEAFKSDAVARLKAMRADAPKGKDMGHAANLRSAQAKLQRMKDTMSAQARVKAATSPPKGDTEPVHLPEKFKTGGPTKGSGVGVTPKPVPKPVMGTPGRKA